MAYWNWINEVYDYDDACVKIDKQQEELSKLIIENARLREALMDIRELEAKKEILNQLDMKQPTDKT